MTGVAPGLHPTILVVDDGPDTLELITALLDDSYQVRVASDGRQALAAAAAVPPPDLILLDVMMPDMDGYQVCRRLKREAATAAIPVIFLTAKTEITDEERGLELGAVDYISKPISPPIIKARIRTHLSLKVSTDSLRATLVQVRTAHRQLQETVEHLVHAEKMAALGQLVAGVAHEINTPLGIAITVATHMTEMARELAGVADQGRIRKSDFKDFLKLTLEASDLLYVNVNRASRLVQSFKQIAVDQCADERRCFDLNAVLNDVLISLGPALKGHGVVPSCPASLVLDGYPGALARILTNLVMNAVTHAFEPGQAGRLFITAGSDGAGGIELVVADDGRGIPAEHRSKIFDPFFTTRRGAGHPGLGLHIVFNLVTTRLGGTIVLDPQATPGSRFVLRVPQTAP